MPSLLPLIFLDFSIPFPFPSDSLRLYSLKDKDKLEEIVAMTNQLFRVPYSGVSIEKQTALVNSCSWPESYQHYRIYWPPFFPQSHKVWFVFHLHSILGVLIRSLVTQFFFCLWYFDFLSLTSPLINCGTEVFCGRSCCFAILSFYF